jgi:hypothetical protein
MAFSATFKSRGLVILLSDHCLHAKIVSLSTTPTPIVPGGGLENNGLISLQVHISDDIRSDKIQQEDVNAIERFAVRSMTCLRTTTVKKHSSVLA